MRTNPTVGSKTLSLVEPGNTNASAGSGYTFNDGYPTPQTAQDRKSVV